MIHEPIRIEDEGESRKNLHLEFSMEKKGRIYSEKRALGLTLFSHDVVSLCET